jgi:hypothetical protein
MDPHPWEAPASSHPPTERDPVQARDFALMKDQHHWCALSHGPQAAPMLAPHALHAGARTPKEQTCYIYFGGWKFVSHPSPYKSLTAMPFNTD